MGRTMIQNRLSRKKLLIVVDDVNEFGQLENLCLNREWFGRGTVMIITTRDIHLLNLLKVDYVYKMHLLNEDDSFELFSWHAFREAKPREEWSDLARNTVAYCEGLPLALQFHERYYVTEILNACELDADFGITVLIERGLIKVERNNKLEMHPLLRDMGREFIRELHPKEPGKRSRLWFQEDVQDVLEENSGTEAIEGLSLKLHSSNRDSLEALAFKKMKRLRLPQLDHVQLSGDYGHISKQLRWICWRGFPYKYIPNNFHLENVIAIDFKHSHLQLLSKQHLVFITTKIV
ncbi:TMV resistance protein N-like [Vigna unguiculata]|uniref:TMV resistance protein N-like n=1 Tax=Vigna unguiculata TaxID=3917 RepID=UPI001015E739|nr:TMV resistance protein N-like [Vigna unguiculata]